MKEKDEDTSIWLARSDDAKAGEARERWEGVVRQGQPASNSDAAASSSTLSYWPARFESEATVELLDIGVGKTPRTRRAQPCWLAVGAPVPSHVPSLACPRPSRWRVGEHGSSSLPVARRTAIKDNMFAQGMRCFPVLRRRACWPPAHVASLARALSPSPSLGPRLARSLPEAYLPSCSS